jgi:hypothetical protein
MRDRVSRGESGDAVMSLVVHEECGGGGLTRG